MRSLTCSCSQRAKLNILIKKIKKNNIQPSYLKKLDSTFIADIKSIQSKTKTIHCPKTEEICEIFTTPNMGRGVRAKISLPKSAKIGCYIGPIKEGHYYDERWKYSFQYVFKKYSVDGSSIESIMSLLNHSDKPNCDVLYEIHKVEDIEEIHLTFILSKDVKRGEEIYIDYGKEYWEFASKSGIIKETRQRLITEYFNSYYNIIDDKLDIYFLFSSNH